MFTWKWHCQGLEKLLMKLHDPKPFVRRAAAATLGDGLRAREN